MGLGTMIAKADVFGTRVNFIDATVTAAGQSRQLNVGPFHEINNTLNGSNEKTTVVLERFRDAFKEAALKAAELQNPGAEKALSKVATLAEEAIDKINQPQISQADLIRISRDLAIAVGICLMWKSPSSLRVLDS